MYNIFHLIIVIVFLLIAMISGFVIIIRKINLQEYQNYLLAANITAASVILLLVSCLIVPQSYTIGGYRYVDSIMIISGFISAILFSLYTLIIVKTSEGKPFLITSGTACLAAVCLIIIVPTFNIVRYCTPIVESTREVKPQVVTSQVLKAATAPVKPQVVTTTTAPPVKPQVATSPQQ